MSERIKDKIRDIEECLNQLDSLKPRTFEEYENDIKTKAACERFVERIMEAVADLAMLIIKDKKLITPEDDSKSFDVLAKAKIINERLATKLREAKGMRNILAHQYREVNDEIIFDAIAKDISNSSKLLSFAISKGAQFGELSASFAIFLLCLKKTLPVS